MRSNKIMNKNYTKNELIEIYNKRLNGEIKTFPNIFKNNLENLKIISIYLFEDILNYTIDDIYENLNEKFLIKYKIVHIVKGYFRSFVDFIQFVYPNKKIYVWFFKLGARNYISNDEIIKTSVEFLIKKYNLSIEDVYKGKITRKIIQENKLDSILSSRFNGSINEYFKWYYDNYTNNIFDIYLCDNKPVNFYTKDICIKIIKDNYSNNLGFNENDYSKKNKNIIIKNFNLKTLNSILSYTTYSKFLGKTIYNVFKSVYPNYNIFQWEFLSVENKFWKNKNNRIRSLKELLSVTKIKMHDSYKILNFEYLKNTQYSKFNSVCSNYYNSDYFIWFNECFPNVLKYKDFHPNVIIHDGCKMNSLHEVKIHDFLKQNFKNVKYIEFGNRNNWIYNERHNEFYCPDWIIGNNIIVEYFGWYFPDYKDERFITYVKKANRKIEFYNSLKNYCLWSIFPKDIKELERDKSHVKALKESLKSKGIDCI